MVRPEISPAEIETKGMIVLGTIQEDIHDIGKNIVKLMFELAVMKVYDLGFDVPCTRFLEEKNRTNA